ncbi:MAG: D-glycerate dehydrogenase [Ardenticatenaceae bacterium]|nr:D-glycerate dehydrogenase [Anaerolineales bacterium]MCB8979599.1 D-glycerate dehydrogenase [Ardenticatenaceae bacterium]
MAKVFVTQHIGDAAVQRLRDAGHVVIYRDETVPMTPDELQTAVRSVDGLVCLLTDRVDTAVLDAAPQLKMVANVAVGYDNIDLGAATRRGILVSNTPDVLTETTADHAFALLLAIARRIPEADTFMRAGKYERFELFPPLLGLDVYGKTLGIVGMGRIGAAVAWRGALGFGMKILYTANSAKTAVEQELGAQKVSLPELLRQSDFVSINTPLTPETRHLFTLETLRQMKPTACLVNTARGPIVKEDDLLTALREGVIWGAALDVFEAEPKMTAGLAEYRERLVVAPHLGSATGETRRKMAETAVANLIAGLAGQKPPNALNPQVWRETSR